MKKLILSIFFIIFTFAACGTLQLADVTRLSPGMTQTEVDHILGRPVRILSSSYTEDGDISVFEYITYRDESYAVEFLNGRLNRYDFMYENTPCKTGAGKTDHSCKTATRETTVGKTNNTPNGKQQTRNVKANYYSVRYDHYN